MRLLPRFGVEVVLVLLILGGFLVDVVEGAVCDMACQVDRFKKRIVRYQFE